MMIPGVVVFLIHLSLSNAAATVTCLNCDDVASPSDCRQTMICGEGEICYTREFVDHRGLQAFSLGCEEETRCSLFLNAQHLFGKRDGPNFDPAPYRHCYDCCEAEECNANLCQDHVSLIHPTATPCPTCTCPKTTCPTSAPCPTCVCPQTTCPTSTCQTTVHQASPGFPSAAVPYKDKYYFFSYVASNWETARNSCKSYGADLVSITSQEQQDFLNQHLNKSGCHHHGYSWTGGAFSSSLHEWVWGDQSPVLYTHWHSGSPGNLTHDEDYYRIAMFNPSCSSSKEAMEGRWVSYATARPLSFICEKEKI